MAETSQRMTRPPHSKARDATRKPIRTAVDRQNVERFTRMDRDPVTVARHLLGQRLVRIINGQRLAGTIVEVEAYLGSEDPAAHTYGGRRTARNESMYKEGGHAYVYFTYGAHFCLNVVCGKRDEGVAVLIRALEPTEGIDLMYRHRFGMDGLAPDAEAPRSGQRPGPLPPVTALCSGPGKLAQAMQIDRRLDGVDLRTSSVLFIEKLRFRPLPSRLVGTSLRIGLNPRETWPRQWTERRLRYFVVGNPHVSR